MEGFYFAERKANSGFRSMKLCNYLLPSAPTESTERGVFVVEGDYAAILLLFIACMIKHYDYIKMNVSGN